MIQRLGPRGRRWLRGSLLASALLVGGLWLADRLWPLPLPEPGLAKLVLAADGSPLWRFADREGVWRYPVQLEQVSPWYVEAVLGYEDRWFWQHPGINPLALLRAGWQNLSSGGVVSGGSTLSMQVARLIEPHERDIRGKLRQIARTLQLEWHLSKREILELYLQRAPFGGTLQGVAAASWSYLGKPPDQLTRAEAALLAVLPQAPSRLRPDRHPERAQAARDKVLRRLAEFGSWPQQAVADALEEPVFLAPRQRPRLAPLLARHLNRPGSGELIRTTIDAGLQQRLEDLLGSWRARLPEHTSAAVLVVEHPGMQVRAYLGSLDIRDSRRFGHVDMVQALRSPGSTLKPFLYGLALDAGLIHSESLLQDVPRHYGDYRPGNFASGFSGPVAASDALARSLNLPAVQLLEVYGPKRFAGELRAAGLPIQLPALSEPSLALILGGGGSRLQDLVAGYSALARAGVAAQLRYRPEDPLVEHRLLSPGAAWIIRRILAGQAQPSSGVLRPGALALKTGTSYGFRDAWAIGVAPHHLIGVWVGRPDGTPVPGQFGLASAAPLLNQVHRLLLSRDNLPPAAVSQPDSVQAAEICWPLGQPLPPGDANCRQRRQAWVLDGTTPPTLPAGDQLLSSSLLQPYWVNDAGLQVAAGCPQAHEQRLTLWPPALLPWLPPNEQPGARLPPTDPACPPVVPAQTSPLRILGVRDGEALQRPPGDSRPVQLDLSSLGGSGQRWWFVDGQPLGVRDAGSVLRQSFEPGAHQIGLLDESGQTALLGFSVLP